MRKQLLLTLSLLFTLPVLNAQEKPGIDKEALIKQAINNSSLQTIIYSGQEQQRYPGNNLEHPYFVQEEYVSANLWYDNIYYPEVYLRLDLYRGEMIIQTPDKRYNIVLVPDKFNKAEMLSHTIIYRHSGGIKGAPPAGYIALLYEGDISVMVRHAKHQKQIIVGNNVKNRYLNSSRYYIYKEGQYYSVNSENALLNVFAPYKKELLQYLRRNKMKFKRSPGEVMVAVVKEYENLSN